MSIRTLIATATLVLLPLAASATTLIVPASGTGPGSNGSQWQTELTLHNVRATPIAVALAFHSQEGTVATQALTIPGHRTTILNDIVATLFGRTSGTGAITLTFDDKADSKLAVASRTFNLSPTGQFGQDIPAVRLTDALTAGDIGVLAAPSSAADFRFNFGIYAAEASFVKWQLLRADGTVAAETGDLPYSAGVQRQYNSLRSLFPNAVAQDGDTVYARIDSGSAVVYGSSINNATGDPSYVPGIRTRGEIAIAFAGVDMNEDGILDAVDADHDGVVDTPVDIFTGLYPNYFRVVAQGPEGQKVHFTILNQVADIVMLDDNVTLVWAPPVAFRGTTGTLHLRATDGTHTAELFVPVHFR